MIYNVLSRENDQPDVWTVWWHYNIKDHQRPFEWSKAYECFPALGADFELDVLVDLVLQDLGEDGPLDGDADGQQGQAHQAQHWATDGKFPSHGLEAVGIELPLR